MRKLSLKKIPVHIAIIMDGNSRWAKMRGLDVLYGHQEGAERVRDVSRYLSKIGVGYLTLFAFSTENWQRPNREVDALMDLLVEFLYSELDEMNKNNIKLLISGRRKNFSENVIKALDRTIRETGTNTGLNLILCLDYGGRQEIVDAANKRYYPTRSAEKAKQALPIQKATETDNRLTVEEFKNYLYLPEAPEVDLLIRTSGEERISNFMLWQLSYSELYFTPVLWPDITEDELKKAIKSYNNRNRRFGMRI